MTHSSIAPSGADTSRQLPFTGRERELTRLAQLRTAAQRGEGQVVLLSGDGGVGKTRLLHEAARTARADGWQVAMGHGYPLETTIPYALFADALGPMLEALDSGALMRITRGDRALLGALAPALLERMGAPARSGDTLPPAEQRVRLHTAIVQLLVKLAERTPLLLALENLQWADSASIELFHVLGRQVPAHRILLVATWNESDREPPVDLRVATRSLRAMGVAHDMRLEPLAREQVGHLVASHFAVEPTLVDTFAARLHHATQGNAFFVDQVLRELVTRGDLRRQGDTWIGWHLEALALPPSVRDVLAARLARLTPDARRLADVLAVAGANATHDVVRMVLDVDEPALHAALQPLREHGLVREQEAGETVAYRFAHPMLQQALVDALGLVRERELHAVIARAVEHTAGTRADAQAEAIAVHWLRADPRHEPDVAVRWLMAAGRDALARLARREAAAMLRAALDRADAHPDRVDQALVPPLLDELMRVYRRLGEYRHAIDMCERAVAHAQATKDTLGVAVAERRHALALQALGRREESLEHFDSAIRNARLAGDAVLVVRTQLARGDALQALGQVEQAKREVADAIATAERLDQVPLLARAHRLQLMLHLWTGPSHRAWAYARSAVQLAEKSGERNLQWHAHFGAAVLAGLTSQTAALATHLAEATRLARALASPMLELRCGEIALEYRAGIGEWDRAIAEGERAVAVARAFDQTTLRARLLHWVSGVYLQRGDHAAATRLVDEAWDAAGADHIDPTRPFEVHGVLPAYVARTRLLVAMGAHIEALHLGHDALAMAERTGYIAWAVYRLLPAMAEAALAIGDQATVALVRERLARNAAHLAHPLGAAWVSVIDGEVAHAAERDAEAIDHLQRAIAQFENVPFPYDAAHARLRLARCFVAHGARDDAVHEAREALAIFERLGARPAADHARSLLRELGARMPAVSSASHAFTGLTSRELEIVRLVAQRLSNKEIGARLGITARTAGTHLANIYEKVGLRDRVGLGDLARAELRDYGSGGA